FHGQPARFPPNRDLKFFSLPRSPLSHPEGRARARFSVRARGGWRIVLKGADLGGQAVLFGKLMPGTRPVRERQEGVETDQGIGLVPRTLGPHIMTRMHMRDGPEARLNRVPMERQASLDVEGGDRELSL